MERHKFEKVSKHTHLLPITIANTMKLDSFEKKDEQITTFNM